jgi:hypothetical protein
MRRWLLLLPFVLAFSLVAVVSVAAQGLAVEASPWAGARGLPVAAVSAEVELAADVPITTPVLSEGFEDWLPVGWDQTTFVPSALERVWRQSIAHTHSMTGSAWHRGDNPPHDAWLVTPQFTPTQASDLVVWQSENYTTVHGMHAIWISLGSGDPKDGDFVLLEELGMAPDPGWEVITISLHSYAGQPVYMAFRYQTGVVKPWYDDWYVDDVEVTSGLIVGHDGPKAPGEVVTLVADAPTGDNVSYAWDLGGGVFKSGAVVTHTYGALGDYTAVVTASNSSSTVVEMAIVPIRAFVYLPLVLRY